MKRIKVFGEELGPQYQFVKGGSMIVSYASAWIRPILSNCECPPWLTLDAHTLGNWA